MNPLRTRILRLGLSVGLVLFVVALSYANYQFTLQSQARSDFLVRWLGARTWIAEGVSPYDSSVSEQAQEIIYGRPAKPELGEDPARFVYPLPSVLFTAPFSLLPLPLARALWMTLLELSLPLLAAASMRLIRWLPGSALVGVMMGFVIFWYPGFRAIVLGDFAALTALLVVVGLLAVDRGYDTIGGVLLALSLTKPEIPILLVPLTVLWAVSRRRWRLVSSLGLTVAALVAGFMILRPTWPIEWLVRVGESSSLSLSGAPLALLVARLPEDLGILAVVLAILLLVYLLWEWVLTWSTEVHRYLWVAMLTLTITQLALFRTATTNSLVLLPALLLLLASWHERWGKKSLWAISGVLLFWLIVPWWLSVVTARGNLENPVVQLPLLFFLLGALLWTRWWAIRGRELINAGSQSTRWPSRV